MESCLGNALGERRDMFDSPPPRLEPKGPPGIRVMTTIAARGRSAEILLVDDNDDDVYLTRRAFRGARLPVNLHHVDNGEKCLAFLRKQGPYNATPTPDLVLLDINMPVMDGHEVLEAINADDTLKHQAVIVLTTSAEESDIRAMYGRRCNSYITKPVDFEKFERMVQQLTDYWLGLVVLPSR
jgi:two-component system response regulator